MATVAETLEMAADKLEPEGAWTQGSYARDANGNALMVGNAPEAVCWCAVGAIDAVTMRGEPVRPSPLWLDAMGALADFVGRKTGLNVSVTGFNDEAGRTQAEVVSSLRAAAAKAREVRSS